MDYEVYEPTEEDIEEFGDLAYYYAWTLATNSMFCEEVA